MARTTSTGDAFAQVRQAITLSSYVETVVGARLRNSGRPGRFAGPCPVHGGDNPTAFTIDDEKGLWYCFTRCQTGGDIFSLWCALNPSGTKKDALVALADVAGVTLPERNRPTRPDDLFRVMSKAARLFHDALVSTEPRIGSAVGSEDAYRWLTVERSVTDNIIDDAHIGFVPDWPGLRAALEDTLGPRRVLIDAGLLTESPNGGIYCPFAGRVTFPIRDPKGRVVGFGARAVPNITRHDERKFVNSRATDIYDKSSVLYGVHRINDDTTRVIVCEGYLDALAVTALEAPGVVGVAACGTSFTRKHLDLLLDVMPPSATVTFVLDGDEAGQKSVSRLAWAVSRLGRRGFARLLDATQGKDPWDRMLAGTLAADIDPDNQVTLIEAITQAARTVAEDDEAFDRLVAAMVDEVDTAEDADDVIRAASRVAGVSPSDLRVRLRQAELSSASGGRRARRGDDNDDNGVVLSAPTRLLVTRLLQADPLEIAALANSAGAHEDFSLFARRWLPVETADDVDALSYLLHPHGETASPEVLRAVSACLPRDGQAESISPILAAVCRTVLHAAARVARDMDEPLTRRARAIKAYSASPPSAPDDLAALATMMDLAREIDLIS